MVNDLHPRSCKYCIGHSCSKSGVFLSYYLIVSDSRTTLGRKDIGIATKEGLGLLARFRKQLPSQ